MKILILNSEFPPIGGGAGNASANIARQMVQQGHAVVLLTVRFGDFPHKETWHGVRIVRVPAIRKKLDRSGPVEQISYILGGIFNLPKLRREISPDIAIAFFGVPSGPIAWILKLFTRTPYIISMRGGDVPGFRPYDFKIYHLLIAPFLRIFWNNADALVANSQGLRKLALEFSPRSDIQLIPNGADLEQYTPVDRDWDSPRLLSVGRVVYQKGLGLAMQALAGLQDLDWSWVIAGDGSERPELEQMAHKIGIASRVQFVGWQSKEQLVKLYQHANLFVFPSRHEGMPNAMLEAMACGLPVIATRIAGSEELIVPDETGLLVPPEDVAALRNGLRQLIPHAAARKRMGAASHARVEGAYSWAGVASQYIQLANTIVERH
ncbi:MAG: glycosyltransferase family 4 protein [Anaerolineales bacterium]|nr:glycosyltransferase family 4 protein [Anaerolineales bacterium]